MPSPELLVAFFFATALFAFMPGPAMLYVAAQTMARGKRAGWFAAVGVSIGGLAHVVAAAAGLSALFAHVPAAYAVLKLAGALYLVWLGVTLIRARVSGEAASAAAEKTAGRAFVDSMIVEILNPKTAIFFLAFLPQFVDPASGVPVWVQLLALGLVVNLMFGLGDVVAVLGASLIIGKIGASERAQRLIRLFGGSLMVGLGLKLAMDRS